MNRFPRFFVLFTLLALSFFSAFFILIYFLYLPHPFFNSDLPAYLTGARIILSPDRSLLYNPGLQLQYQTRLLVPYHLLPTHLLPFRYLPFAALVYVPLTLFSFSWAYFANILLSLLTLVLCLLLIRRSVSDIPLWFLLPLAFSPVVYSLLLNQPVLFITLSFFLTSHFYTRNRPFSAGLSLILLFIKPQYFFISAIILLVSIPKYKQRPFLAGVVCSLIFCLTVNLFLVGPHTLLSYPSFVLLTESPLFGTPISQLINFSPPVASVILALLLILMLVLKPSFVSTLIYLPFFLCLLSGHTLGQDLSLLLFPLFSLIRPRPRFTLFLLITISLSFFIFPKAISLLVLFSGFYLLLFPPRPEFNK